MKTKIISSLLLGIYFIGGFGIGFSEVFAFQPTANDGSYNNVGGADVAGGNYIRVNGDWAQYVGGGTEAEVRIFQTQYNTTHNLSPGDPGYVAVDGMLWDDTAEAMNIQGAERAATDKKVSDEANAAANAAAMANPDNMMSPNFRLDPSNLSPSEKKYDKGTKENFKVILANIGRYLLIATTTIAVLSIVVWGLMITTTGSSDRAAKGKTIIFLNIGAVVVALFSYSIIRLVSWLIA